MKAMRAMRAVSALWRRAAVGLMLTGALGASGLACAADPSAASAADPALEAQVMRISAELRCLVCQNQTIADSNAELALDLRNQVRDMVKRGETQAQIVDYMTARYGDFVLYRPPVKGTTALLWFGPAALLVVGLGSLVFILRRRARMAPDRFEADPEDLPS
jgi:cytochrome c-type biogenesis protein CcmH